MPAGTFFAAGQGVIEFAGQDDQTYSLFAQADWDIGDRTVLTLRLNYTNMEKNARVSQINTDAFSQLDLVQVGFGAVFGAIAGTFLDPKYDSVPNSALGDLSGQTPAGIHEASVSIAGTYYYQLGNGSGFIRADYLYEDEVQVVDNVPASVASRKVGMLNASISYTFNDRYEVMLWGRNLTNDDYLLSAFPSVAQAGSISGYPNQPRTYGVTLRIRFE